MINLRITLLGAAVALALPGCSSTKPPAHEMTWQQDSMPQQMHPFPKAYGYQCVFYPKQNVYFEPYTKTYAWYEDGRWQQDQFLPRYYDLKLKDHKIIAMPAFDKKKELAWKDYDALQHNAKMLLNKKALS